MKPRVIRARTSTSSMNPQRDRVASNGESRYAPLMAPVTGTTTRVVTSSSFADKRTTGTYAPVVLLSYLDKMLSSRLRLLKGFDLILLAFGCPRRFDINHPVLGSPTANGG